MFGKINMPPSLHSSERPLVRTPDSRKQKKRPPRTTPKEWTDRLGARQPYPQYPPSGGLASPSPSRDEASRSSGSTLSTISGPTTTSPTTTTPSSVLIAAGMTGLSRDLSDLSGSYLNGNATPTLWTKTNVGSSPHDGYQSDQSVVSLQRPWCQARVLSSREPMHPQPPTDDDASADAHRKLPVVLVDPNSNMIEVVRQDGYSGWEYGDNRRIPLILLLMDPARKLYELMQLWIDTAADSVRDVLNGIRLNLGDHWRQDYDGLFQIRNNHFSQLIHILNVSKYDVQPYEVWVAKPWSMSAKATVGYASPLLNYIKQLGVLEMASCTETSPWKLSRPKNNDTILSLSQKAQARIFVPGGVLKHYHACQFLSFTPPFEPAVVRVDVLGADADDGTASELTGSHFELSQDGIDVLRDALSASGTSTSDFVSRRSRGGSSAANNRSVETTAISTNDWFPKNAIQSDMFEITGMVQSHHIVDTDDDDMVGSHSKRMKGIGRALAALHCGCRRNVEGYDDDRGRIGNFRGSSDTFMDSSSVGGVLWRVWEEESKASHASIISESAPLLVTRPTTSRMIEF